MELYLSVAYCIVFIIVVSGSWYLTCVYQLELVLFVLILYIVLSVDTIYIHFEFQSTLTSIIAKFIQLLNMFIMINCIAIGFSECYCRLYYIFIDCYCLTFNHSFMIYLSITLSELILYNIFQWIKQYFNYLNDKFDSNKSRNDKNCQSDGYRHFVSIDCTYILICIISVSCIIHLVYPLIHYLLFQEIILLQYFMHMQIILIIIQIVYSIMLVVLIQSKNEYSFVHYVYCMIFTIVGICFIDNNFMYYIVYVIFTRIVDQKQNHLIACMTIVEEIRTRIDIRNSDHSIKINDSSYDCCSNNIRCKYGANKSKIGRKTTYMISAIISSSVNVVISTTFASRKWINCIEN